MLGVFSLAKTKSFSGKNYTQSELLGKRNTNLSSNSDDNSIESSEKQHKLHIGS